MRRIITEPTLISDFVSNFMDALDYQSMVYYISNDLILAPIMKQIVSELVITSKDNFTFDANDKDGFILVPSGDRAKTLEQLGAVGKEVSSTSTSFSTVLIQLFNKVDATKILEISNELYTGRLAERLKKG